MATGSKRTGKKTGQGSEPGFLSAVGGALRVPSGRLERAARWGMLTGGMAAGFVGEGVRRVASGASFGYSELVFNDANARRLLKSLGRMRGAAMKLGQALSMELEGLVPPAFTEILAALQASGNTMTDVQLHRVLGQAWGKGWRDRFAEFDETPFAAASIGQVHRARTKNGRTLAVKVQFPGVSESIGADLGNLATLLAATGVVPAGYDLKPLLAQLRTQLEGETDYRREGENLARYADLLESDTDIVVPRPLKKLTTKHVLAMDFVAGVPISTLWTGGAPQATRDRVAAQVIRVVLRELFEFGFMQSDPNFGNFLVDGDRLVCLDLGSAIDIEGFVQERIRELIRLACRGDRAKLMKAFREWDWVGDESDDKVEPIADLMILITEPLRHRGTYDFSTSDLAERARTLGLEIVFRRGMRRPPPPEMVFVNRKLGGTYLLCAKLGAKLKVADMAAQYVDLR
jgi:predicted unusual protein kinase regulating ubiquinone biosynthesis (AarF/ABC1/UbiB family)